ncbi:MAG: glycosyltransferase family 9 protein [Myxococcales bacterium]|nr:glycosyltransferase family 9 protein [Myxococcales bacterium]
MNWPPPDVVETLQVLRLSSLGDVLLCEPAIAALAARYPAARLSVVTRPRYAALVRHHPAVAAVLDLAEARRAPAPDLAVDLHNRVDTRRQAARARAARHWRKRRGWDLVRGVVGRPLAGDAQGGPHQVVRMLEGLGLGPARAPRVYVDDAARRRAAPHRRSDAVVLLPAASKALKRWPVEHFARLARSLVADGWPVQVAGGPGEEAALRAVAAGEGVVPTDLPLDALADVLGAARLVIGADTGLLHLAAAAGAPVLGLFGPTAPGRWGPPADRGAALWRAPPCAPCSDHGAGRCRVPGRPCLEALDPAAVAAAATAALRASGPRGDGGGVFPVRVLS